MKRFGSLLILSLIVVIPLVLGMASPTKMTNARVRNAVINVETEPNLEIHEGYVSQKEETVLVKKGRKTIARIHLSEPVIVSQAEQEELWGYFQFPKIGRADDGTLVVTWNMCEDSPNSYGKPSTRALKPMMSKDEGKTWQPVDRNYDLSYGWCSVSMKNGDQLEVSTPSSKNITSYPKYPKAISTNGDYSYYPIDSLPDDLQGVYFTYKKKGGGAHRIHAKVNDPGLVRYSIGGQMPIVWWGNIKQQKDGALIAGVYPTVYRDTSGRLSESSVSFYQSVDNGHTWSVKGKIPFLHDGIADVIGDSRFDEPAYEVLRDGSFVSVMRTGSSSPLYIAFSGDEGRVWTTPYPFTPNGVQPNLLLMNNGVLALTSGRPGIQLRLSLDGSGKVWTEPIEMMPFTDDSGKYSVFENTCGYTSTLLKNDNTFYLVYSDFKEKNEEGVFRKAIIIREVQVIKN